jgi:hypothetical protein
VTGAAAAKVVLDQPREVPAPGGRLSRLAETALRYVQELQLVEEAEVARRLYLFNTVPFTRGWDIRLPNPASVLSWLSAKADRDTARLLTRLWNVADPESSHAGWWLWTRRDPIGERGDWRSPPFKLYLSPLPGALPGIWSRAVASFSEAEVPAFKLGRDARGILRADKLVAYLRDFETLARLSDRLRASLSGCPAQGVPFTASIDPDGLISWGMDPPATAAHALDPQGESWRQWITLQLGRALIAGQRVGAGRLGCQPWEYALSRLRVLDVDTTTWTPMSAIWRRT